MMTSLATELGPGLLWDEDEGVLPDELLSLIFEDPEMQGSQKLSKEAEAPQLLSDFVFTAAEPTQQAGSRGSSRAAPTVSTRQRKHGIQVSKTGKRHHIRIMEEQAAKQAALVGEVETINHQLKLRTKAMEYAVDVRSQLLSVLVASRERQPNAAIQWAESASSSTLAAAFRSFVQEASLILLDLGSETPQLGDPRLERLTNMVFDFTRGSMTVFVLKPHIQFYMMTHRADRESPGEDDDGPAPGHWARVAAGLELTPQQREELIACWDLTNTILAKSQRSITAAQLELARELECSKSASSSSVESVQKRLMAAMANQSMTMKAHCLMVIGKILTPVQTARSLVHSFPYFPNGREIIDSLSTMYQF